MTYKKKAYYLMIGFLCFSIQNITAKHQKVADSLKKIYNQKNLDDSAKFELVRDLACFNPSVAVCLVLIKTLA